MDFDEELAQYQDAARRAAEDNATAAERNRAKREAERADRAEVVDDLTQTAQLCAERLLAAGVPTETLLRREFEQNPDRTTYPDRGDRGWAFKINGGGRPFGGFFMVALRDDGAFGLAARITEREQGWRAPSGVYWSDSLPDIESDAWVHYGVRDGAVVLEHTDARDVTSYVEIRPPLMRGVAALLNEQANTHR